MKSDKLYLVGFMGAGKTTLARALARRLGWRAEDVDQLIETRERRTVAQIFSEQGEPYFRAAERDVVRQLLPVREVVVATGGGTFVDPESRALIRSDGATLWLDIPLGLAIERAPRDGRRPLAADRARFEALYLTRRAAYQQAHARFDASLPREELVERVLDWLGY